ncbi:hypothetical protein AU381_04130 [Sinorhizobium glycinis]|uniref:Uncharacterized protein n=1 Tax=Sinorhizobium glycinis TaxID=1472378 RepID=A0A178Y254_9HYPH|nr:hypothetical protein [Sinorhizobium glycinis]OAP41083.1 hypothetical protein AU381_04130 [Sinorhizobium glycinis]
MQTDHQSYMPRAEESLPDVLMRIVTELHDVAYLIERIEPQLWSGHDAPVTDPSEKLMVLQGVDLAVQKARGLAEFIDTITASIPDTCLVDISTAVNLIKLADMKKALGSGLLRHGHSQPLTKASGDFEAF